MKDSSSPTITCANDVCPIKEFHAVCILPSAVTKTPKKWYCPHCRKLPEFKPGQQKKEVKGLPKVQPPKDLSVCKETVCICKSKPVEGEKLLKCHNDSCENGSYFHLPCLQYKIMPNNSKTTWLCQWCKCKDIKHEKSKAISSEKADNILITKVTVGQTEKYARSGEVAERDFALIKARDGWMNDVIVHQAQALLKKKNPLIEGFQWPTLGPVRNYDIVSSEFIQIIHTGNSHWVWVSSVGCQENEVKVYDSLYNNLLSSEIEQRVDCMLGGVPCNITVASVQQQQNGFDCGIFAIAFATCLTLGQDPTLVEFNIPQMRRHLYKCIESGNMELFPTLS